MICKIDNYYVDVIHGHLTLIFAFIICGLYAIAGYFPDFFRESFLDGCWGTCFLPPGHLCFRLHHSPFSSPQVFHCNKNVGTFCHIIIGALGWFICLFGLQHSLRTSSATDETDVVACNHGQKKMETCFHLFLTMVTSHNISLISCRRSSKNMR